MEFLQSLHPLAWVALAAVAAALLSPLRALREARTRPWRERDHGEGGGPPEGSCGAPHMGRAGMGRRRAGGR